MNQGHQTIILTQIMEFFLVCLDKHWFSSIDDIQPAFWCKLSNKYIKLTTSQVQIGYFKKIL